MGEHNPPPGRARRADEDALLAEVAAAAGGVPAELMRNVQAWPAPRRTLRPPVGVPVPEPDEPQRRPGPRARPLAEYVRDLCEPLGEVSLKPFFGAWRLVHEDTRQFAIIAYAVFLRVDDLTAAPYDAAGTRCFSYWRSDGQVQIRGYREVPPDAFAGDGARFTALAAEAVAAAHRTVKPERGRRRP
jgi:TfoX/Sxy family transcriptional regulator of competence genes